MGKLKLILLGLTILIMVSPLVSGAIGEEESDFVGRIALTEKERLAVAAAFANTIVTKEIENQHLEAEVSGYDSESCALVIVKTLSANWKEINQYRICGGLISEQSEPESESSEQASFDDFVQNIRRKAQQFGMAHGIFQDRAVKAVKLERDAKCTVEVGVYEKKKLTRQETYPCD